MLEGLFGTWELRLLVSVGIAIGAIGAGLLVRRARKALKGHVNPITLDLGTSTTTVLIVITTAVLIADLWGQTGVIFEQLGFIRLDARAPEVAMTIVIVIAIQVFVGIARRLLDDLTHASGTLTGHQREVGVRLTQLGLWGIGIMVILGVWDIDLTGILVGAGFLGIVLGLASRKTLGSLIAGLVLMFARPFEVGEWIAVDGKEGTVTDITLLSTRIRSFEGERVVVPNDVITGEIVTNRTREGRLRASVDIGIDYDDDVGQATELAQSIAEDVAAETETALDSPDPSVLVRALDDSAVLLSVRVWVDKPSAREVNHVKHELLAQLKTSFDEEGISIPYPQRELSTRDERWRVQVEDDA